MAGGAGHHALVGVRAFGEAIFWGIVAGAVYVPIVAVTLILPDSADVRSLTTMVSIGFVLGLAFGGLAGVVAGVPYAIVVGGLSAVSRHEVANAWVTRVLGGMAAAFGVALFCLATFDDPTFGASTPSQYLVMVGLPALIAAVLLAWRAPIILMSRTPAFVAKGTPPPLPQEPTTPV